MLRLPPVYPRGMEDGQTEGANMAKTAAKLGGIPGYGLCFAAGGVGIIPIVVAITKELLPSTCSCFLTEILAAHCSWVTAS